MKRALFLSTIFVCLTAALPALAGSVILPHRVIDCRSRTVVDFEGLLARCTEARVVTLGENHDDPATHLVELALLEGLFRRHGDVVLSMEMFERDVQDAVDQYIRGELSEEEFLAESRPWGNYETDYRPLVEFALKHSIPVVAANVPRHLPSRVSRGGYELAEFFEDELPLIASTFEAPQDAYWESFAATMRMPGMEAMGVTEDTVRWYYEAQVLKDETMAESVTRASEAAPDAVVYHVTGVFHVANYLGTFARIRRDLPSADCVSIIAVPVDDILAPPPEGTPKADYWVLVLAPPDEEEPIMPEIDESSIEEAPSGAIL